MVGVATFRSRAQSMLTIPNSALLPSLTRMAAAASFRCLSSATQRVPPIETVGFVGLGNMGYHMATNLIRAGYNLVVHDISTDAMKKLSDKGARMSNSPREVSESSDAIITMLPSSSHVLDVYTGKNGFLHSGKSLRSWLLIDSSTVDPKTSRKLSEAVSKYSVEGFPENAVMLDAPVSGGVLGAEAATLTFMVGGLEKGYHAARSLLLSMGKQTVYCGGAGNGAAAKVCNNLAMAVSMLGVSEALALGQSLGIKASTLTSIFNSSSARCWSSDTYNPVPGVMEGVPSSRNYDGGFSSKLMVKDLELAAVSADDIGVEVPLAAKALKIYNQLCTEGFESKDFSCAFQHYYNGRGEIP